MKILWKKVRQLSIKREVEQSKMDLYSVLIPTILSTEIFKNNRDIKELVDLLKVQDLKDYLYDSRTALLARLIREIQKNNEEDLNFNINEFKKKSLDIIERKNLIEQSEITGFINKYSRNNKGELDE
ncbi:hypothetical protein BSK64_15610 [Paenibacillus odorifer]|uniref:hypothetical protein n=1 Tax=Paenibacillus odorifer TaxID=189426 RepID=UPI00096CAF03|nr:hypothetical protein [Paenibacillus odorifer]OME04670.1 hypothetical protein BSK64_15610 [Paenibacillus odorifer]